jgi:hypothetical protein
MLLVYTLWPLLAEKSLLPKDTKKMQLIQCLSNCIIIINNPTSYSALFRYTVQPQYRVSLGSSGFKCSTEENLKLRKFNTEITDMESLKLNNK